MKRHFILSLLTFIFCLLGCNKEEDTSIIDTRPVLSYFKGIVNDELINYEQRDKYEHKIWNGSLSLNGDSIISYSWGMGFYDNNNDTLSILVTLYPFQKGLCQIAPIKGNDLYYPELKVYYYTPKGRSYYKPIERTPFHLYIDDIDIYNKVESPIVTGRMEGVVYKWDNPKDSIVFKEVSFRVQNHPKTSPVAE